MARGSYLYVVKYALCDIGNIAKRRLYTRLVCAYFLLPGRQFVVYALYFALYCASAYIFVLFTVLVFLMCYIGLYGLRLFYKRRNRGSLSVITGGGVINITEVEQGNNRGEIG
jgi:hypothetical protein